MILAYTNEQSQIECQARLVYYINLKLELELGSITERVHHVKHIH